MTPTHKDGPDAVNVGAATTPTGETMIAILDGRKEVSVMGATYANGTLHGRLMCVTADAAWQVPVTIGGVTQQQGMGYLGALARLMGGAVVMDGADLMAIRDSLDNARGVA